MVKTLQGALESGRIGHAYLFTGSRGTGKTSLARVFAKSLACRHYQLGRTALLSGENPDTMTHWQDVQEKIRGSEIPCSNCEECKSVEENRSLDLIEIDAASNRGIDEIRNLKDSALVAAPSGGYKIFIIDEVHMLTKDAFNALLKILEEPPKHVIFILATTEAHKILPTVLSRVQRFDFRRLNQSQVSEKLTMMAKKEGINVNPDAIKTIAMSSDGALRDAEVALSKIQASTDGESEITAEDVNEILGLVSYKCYPELVGLLADNDRAGAVSLVNKVFESGADMENFAGNLVEYLRKVLMAKINPTVLVSVNGLNGEEVKNMSALGDNMGNQKLIKMIVTFSRARTEIKNSPVPQLPLELAILEFETGN